MLAEDIAQGHIVDIQVRGVDNDARAPVNLARHTDTQPDYRRIRGEMGVIEGSRRQFNGALGNEVLPAFGAGALARRGNDFARGYVNDCGKGFGSPQVDAQGVHFLFRHIFLTL
jgi:hypothetical protein